MLTSVGVLAATAQDAGGTAAVPVEAWAVFLALVGATLLVDLKVAMREPHTVSAPAAAIRSAVWIALGVGFTAVVWVWLGGTAAQEYIAAYLIEASLSLDNVVVWVALFGFFAVPAKHQPRVLARGVAVAIAFRLAFIVAGVALLGALSWFVFVVGAFLLYTAWKLFGNHDVEVDPEHNPLLVRIRRWMPHTEGYRGDRFVVRERGRYLATPLLMVLVSIELTDVLFAVDSIPATLAITTNEFIVFSSNTLAILGMRALFVVLAGLQDRVVHLDRGLGLILGFAGATFIVEGFGFDVPTPLSLGVIAAVLALTFWLSWRHDPQRRAAARGGHEDAGREDVAGRNAAED